MTAVLEFSNVSRSYKRGVPVLKDITFNVGEGEVVGLLGRNGVGKTTLIKIALGLLYPGSGVVRVFGLSPTDHPVAVKKRIGYVAEGQSIRGGATIAEAIAFHRYLFEHWNETFERTLLDRFGLSPKDKIRRLSKGQKRQVSLLCALCHRPELLLLDEPASGLDPAARREFLEASIQLLNQEGATILFSSHHMADVERIGGRIVLLDECTIRLDKDLDSVRENICVAIVPRASVSNPDVITSMPGCLRVRQVNEDWHAVVEGTPEMVRGQLISRLGQNGVRCERVPLEDLFIELVGSKRSKEDS